MTMSLRRPVIASCASDWCVSVASATRALLRARLAAPLSDLGGIMVSGGWVSCASLCVEASERAFFYFRPQNLGRFNFPLTNRWLGFPHPRRLLWSAKCPSRGMPRVLRMST